MVRPNGSGCGTGPTRTVCAPRRIGQSVRLRAIQHRTVAVAGGFVHRGGQCMARVITASTLVGNELADRCSGEVQGAGKHHRLAVAEERGIELLCGGIDATRQRPRQLRHAADHRGAVEVMAAGTARAIAGEQQRTTVRREHRRELVGRAVHRGPRFSGSPNRPSRPMLTRYRSSPPWPPARSEQKCTVRPSAERRDRSLVPAC